MTQLDGRVFTRLQQYNNLPTELKREVEELEKYLKKIQAEICYPHHTLKLKTVYGVRKQVLLGKIDEWVKSHPHGAGHGVGQSLGQGHGVGHSTGHDHGSTAAAHVTGSDGVHASSTSTGTSTSKTERVKDDVMHPTSHGHTQTHGTDPYASKTERIKDDVMHPTSHGHTQTHGTDPYASKTERIKDDVMHPTSHGHTQTHGTDPYASKTERIKDDVMHPTSHGHSQTHGTDPYASKTERIKDDVMHPTSHGHTQTHGTDPYASKTERIKDDVLHPTSHGHTQTHGTDPYASKTDRIKDDLKHPTSHGHTHAHGTDVTTKPHHGTTATTSPATNTNVGNNQVAGSASPATGSVPPVSIGKGGATGHTPHAEKLLDALVLKGFVTPHKEDKPKNATPATDLDFKNNELFVARGGGSVSSVAVDVGPSVWDLVDGAVFAGMIKRKAGLLEPIIHGKATYAVVNSRLRTLALFKTDLSRKPKAQFSGRSLHVSFDKSHYEHGVKVWNETDSELLDMASHKESNEIVEALVSIGASLRGALGQSPAVTTGEKVRHEAKKAVGAEHDGKHVTGHEDKTKHHALGDHATTHRGEHPHDATTGEKVRHEAKKAVGADHHDKHVEGHGNKNMERAMGASAATHMMGEHGSHHQPTTYGTDGQASHVNQSTHTRGDMYQGDQPQLLQNQQKSWENDKINQDHMRGSHGSHQQPLTHGVDGTSHVNQATRTGDDVYGQQNQFQNQHHGMENLTIDGQDRGTSRGNPSMSTQPMKHQQGWENDKGMMREGQQYRNEADDGHLFGHTTQLTQDQQHHQGVLGGDHGNRAGYTTGAMSGQQQPSHSMEKQGLTGEHGSALHGNQQGYTADNAQYQQQHGLTGNDNLKREYEEPRGFSQVNDPTRTP